MALPHHGAAHGDEGRRGEPELVRAEEGGHHDVAPAADLPVCLQDHAGTQVVHGEHLVRLGDSQFPGEASVLDARPAGRSSAAIVARYGDVLSFSLK